MYNHTHAHAHPRTEAHTQDLHTSRAVKPMCHPSALKGQRGGAAEPRARRPAGGMLCQAGGLSSGACLRGGQQGPSGRLHHH